MSRFKVGDRVTVDLGNLSTWRIFGYGAEPGIVKDCGSMYYVELILHAFGDDGRWCAREEQLTPASPVIPDGWTTADEPPSNDRNVEIVLPGGKNGYGWHSQSGGWTVFNESASIEQIKSNWQYRGRYIDSYPAAPGEVICWREIQPERLRVGQRVRVKEDARGAEWCTYRAGEVGTIIEYDDQDRDCPYRVEFAVDWWWCYADDLEPLPDETKPEPEDRVDYVVVYDGDEDYGVAHKLDDALDMAKVRSRYDDVTVAVYRKICHVNPGKPEVIWMEEE